MFYSGGVRYKNLDKKNGFLTTSMDQELEVRAFNRYLAFDVFFKNDSDSPVADELFFDYITQVSINEGANEEMMGLFNSLRIGIVKIGSVPMTAYT